MNREEILNMPAGREMDVLIAEKVMGWKKDTTFSDVVWDTPNGLRTNKSTSYYSFMPSIDIAAAWEVAEKFIDAWNVDVNNLMDNNGDWMATLQPIDDKWFVSARADTAPLAICRAALLVTLERET